MTIFLTTPTVVKNDGQLENESHDWEAALQWANAAIGTRVPLLGSADSDPDQAKQAFSSIKMRWPTR